MDHYATLGVNRNSTPDEIKQAYRRLASKNHPDKGGDTATFQRIQEAYDILIDPQKRQQYDNPPMGGFQTFGFGGGQHPFQDIFRDFFNQHQRQQRRVYTTTLFVGLDQVARGARETIHLQTPIGPKMVEVEIPLGLEDGTTIRYTNILPDGDLQINFRIRKHPIFERRGLDLYTNVSVNFFDLILGFTLRVENIHGKLLELDIPPITRSESTFRLGGQGLTNPIGNIGDQYVLIKGQLPDTIDSEVIQALEVQRSKKDIGTN
jgi:DnaJ-class molecular chaperone